MTESAMGLNGMAETLAGKLARYPGPGFRKAYFANLLESGKRFQAAGNARGADYCFAKVGEGLKDVPDPVATSGDSEEMAESGRASGGMAEASATAHIREAKPKQETAADRLRVQWRMEHLQSAESILEKHGDRLSALEQQSYRDQMHKLRELGEASATRAQADKADAGLLDLRRRLYRRVLKSQKVSLHRKPLPVAIYRLPSSTPSGDIASHAEVAGKPIKSPEVSSAPAGNWAPAVGPYNDRYNIEDLLSLVSDVDPAWVEELLDLYRGLAGVQSLVTALAAAKK